MMRQIWATAIFACLYLCHVSQAALNKIPHAQDAVISPQVMIVSMFESEAKPWFDNFTKSGLGDLYSKAINVPGLSMEYPDVHCTLNQSVCHVTTGMAEINAAATIMALTLSQQFDFRSTYWLLGGIAGVNPKAATMGSVALSQFAVQVALQYEFDPRDAPENFTTGYFPIGTTGPGNYPTIIYGTEVMEVNKDLRDAVSQFARNTTLADSPGAQIYRSRYDSNHEYIPAMNHPSVISCDTATSDVYYSGGRLSQGFEDYMSLMTNGTANYCMTAQEDNAILEVLLRMNRTSRVDYSRVILMRTGSNFDRPPPGVSAYQHLTQDAQNGFNIAIENLYRAGIEIVKGIVGQWDCTYKRGIVPSNYIGDIWGSLGGTPNFGPGPRNYALSKARISPDASDSTDRTLRRRIRRGRRLDE